MNKLVEEQKENAKSKIRDLYLEIETQGSRYNEQILGFKSEIALLRENETNNQSLLQLKDKSIKDKEETIERLQKTNSKLNDSLFLSRNDVDEFMENQKRVQTQIIRLQSEIKIGEEARYDLEEKIRDAERTTEQLENEKHRKNMMFEDERKNLEHKIQSKMMEIDDLKLRSNEEKNEFEIHKKKKDEEIGELHELNIKYRNEGIELKSELINKKEEIDNKDKKLYELTQTLIEKQEGLEKQQRKIEELFTNQDALEIKLFKFRDDISNKKRELSELTTTNILIQNKYDIINTESETIVAELERITNSHNKLTEDIKKLDENLRNTQSKYEITNQDCVDLERELKNQLIENEDILERFDKERGISDELRIEKDDLESDLSELNTKLNEEMRARETLQQDYDEIGKVVINALAVCMAYGEDFTYKEQVNAKSNQLLRESFRNYFIKLGSELHSQIQDPKYFHENSLKLSEAISELIREFKDIVLQLYECKLESARAGKQNQDTIAKIQKIQELEKVLDSELQRKGLDCESKGKDISHLLEEREIWKEREHKMNAEIEEVYIKINQLHKEKTRLEREVEELDFQANKSKKEISEWKNRADHTAIMLQERETRNKILNAEKQDFENIAMKINSSLKTAELQSTGIGMIRTLRELHSKTRDKIANEKKLQTILSEYKSIDTHPLEPSGSIELNLKYEIERLEKETATIDKFIETLEVKLCGQGLDLRQSSTKRPMRNQSKSSKYEHNTYKDIKGIDNLDEYIQTTTRDKNTLYLDTTNPYMSNIEDLVSRKYADTTRHEGQLGGNYYQYTSFILLFRYRNNSNWKSISCHATSKSQNIEF